MHIYHEHESEDLPVISSDSPSVDLTSEDEQKELNVYLFYETLYRVPTIDVGHSIITRVFKEYGYIVPEMPNRTEEDGAIINVYLIDTDCYLLEMFFRTNKQTHNVWEIHAEILNEEDVNRTIAPAELRYD